MTFGLQAVRKLLGIQEGKVIMRLANSEAQAADREEQPRFSHRLPSLATPPMKISKCVEDEWQHGNRGRR